MLNGAEGKLTTEDLKWIRSHTPKVFNSSEVIIIAYCYEEGKKRIAQGDYIIALLLGKET